MRTAAKSGSGSTVYLGSECDHARRTWTVEVSVQLSIRDVRGTHPPWSQMIQGSVLFASAGAVSVPFAPCFSNAQKNSVSFGWPWRLTGMLPANVRGMGPVMLGSFSVTSKSACDCRVSSIRENTTAATTHISATLD